MAAILPAANDKERVRVLVKQSTWIKFSQLYESRHTYIYICTLSAHVYREHLNISQLCETPNFRETIRTARVTFNALLRIYVEIITSIRNHIYSRKTRDWLYHAHTNLRDRVHVFLKHTQMYYTHIKTLAEITYGTLLLRAFGGKLIKSTQY